jgi:hypothetical protein
LMKLWAVRQYTHVLVHSSLHLIDQLFDRLQRKRSRRLRMDGNPSRPRFDMKIDY